MPCEECENGRYKWGETGECQYDTMEDCQLANQGEHLEESLKPKGDVPVDWAYNFSQEQMNELHEEGEIMVEVDKDGEPMILLFTYNVEKEDDDKDDDDNEREEQERINIEEEEMKEYAKLTVAMLDDELDEYIDKLTSSIKKL